MEQTPQYSASILTVKELTGYLHNILESDDLLRNIWVQGEISNVSHSSSGHIYFTLKDQVASVRCAMWRTNAMQLVISLQDGQFVEAHGYVDIYETGGQLQFYADKIRLAGEGDLYQKFLELKTKLEAEGLFEPTRKRPLPEFPHTIGIVTSPSGAALQDILNVLKRRYPLAEVILAPTPVQGNEAPVNILSALTSLIEMKPDVILVARGGGSLEDLWAFNDEAVARAIADSPIPVVTGIGHETDFTLSDFVSDLRAPTPTAAAELATPNKEDLLSDVSGLSSQLSSIIRHIFDNLFWQIKELSNLLASYSPVNYISHQFDQVSGLNHRLYSTTNHKLDIQGLSYRELNGRLQTLSPDATLKRGFAIVTNLLSGNVISHKADVGGGEHIKIKISDGAFNATVSQE